MSNVTTSLRADAEAQSCLSAGQLFNHLIGVERLPLKVLPMPAEEVTIKNDLDPNLLDEQIECTQSPSFR